MSTGCNCSKEGDIAILKTENKTIFKEIKDLKSIQTTILDLTRNITVLVEQMRETKEDVKAIKEDMEKIKSGPTDDYKHYKRIIISGLITAVVGFFVGKFL